jgi:glycosyltransferase involved in cell wall biosynthesis
MQSSAPEHICVCVCTYRRPHLLQRLLRALSQLQTEGAFTHSVVVVDNDREGSARSAVEAFTRSGALPVCYEIEPQQNIALARNRAIAAAAGDYVALVDDDELPDERWLLELHGAVRRMAVDGVLAPVLPRYEQTPPSWVLKGRFFDRPAPRTGELLQWTQTRSGNALLRRAVFERHADWFDPAFGSGGEDRDFFRRKIAQHYLFGWTNDAPVHESVPAGRWDERVLLKRALLRGKMALRAADNLPLSLLKSALALPAYALALPVAGLAGRHVLMQTLIRACDHLGKLLAFLRVSPVRESYVQAQEPCTQ